MTTQIAHRRRAWMVATLAGSALAGLGAVVAFRFAGRDLSLERVRQAGVLRVGYSVEPPFAVVAPDGTVTGQSADSAAAVARALGVRVEWVQTSLNRQIPDLLADRFDVVGAGLFWSPERAAQVRFSVPTLRVRPAWLTRAASQAPTLQRLRNGWNVAVVSGSAAEPHVAGLGLAERLHRVPDAKTGVAGLRQGVYDALAVPWPAGRHLAAGRAAELTVWPADDGRPERIVALAFRPADGALAAAADATLAQWVQSADYLALLARHELTPNDLPARPKVATP